MARNSNGESVFSRIVRVFEAFGPQTPVLTVSELARRTGMSMPTVSRLVAELTEHGWLVRDDERGLRVGVRMWELASRASSTVDLCRVAMPYATELLASVGHPVQIGVRQGRDILVVERLSAPGAEVGRGRYASRYPLVASASGLVLLAYTALEFQEAVLSEDGRAADPKELRGTLSEIRASGCAFCPGLQDPEVTVIAVPLRIPGGQVVAALSAAVPNDERARSAVTAVRVTGARICRAYADRYHPMSGPHGSSSGPAGEGRRGATPVDRLAGGEMCSPISA